VDHLLRATALAESRHFWFRGFRRFVEPLVRQATDGVSDGRILDCGCGTGANVAWLSRYGRTYGFDLSAVGLQIGRAAGRTRLAQATVAAAPFPGDAFDLVTSFDVLYSLDPPDEHAAVAEMFRMARPGGYVIVNVAAMEALRGYHSVLSREVRRYSRQGLSRLLTGAGFTVVRITYTNAVLFAPMYVSRVAQRRRGLAVADDTADVEIRLPPEPVNSVLSGLLLLESLWLKLFDNPFGSSLLCLARKPPAPPVRSPRGSPGR
jgi:ubiquinone/menaquinone biosynthesis C-methylase UbiE